MNGIEFYEYLRNNYNHNGQPLYNYFTFCDWLYKPRNGTFSFSFNIINNNPKAIPRNIITAAWDANQEIDVNWIEDNFDLRFHNLPLWAIKRNNCKSR
jgi:fibronectin type 3 domain-containing protein